MTLPSHHHRRLAGTKGESLVDNYFKSHQWAAIQKNVRWKYGEIDRIYQHKNKILLCEIKFRTRLKLDYDFIKSTLKFKQIRNLKKFVCQYEANGFKCYLRLIIVGPQLGLESKGAGIKHVDFQDHSFLFIEL